VAEVEALANEENGRAYKIVGFSVQSMQTTVEVKVTP